MPVNETPLDRFLRELHGGALQNIFIAREPSELTSGLFETHDALMKCLDVAWRMQDPRLYDEVFELLAKTAAIIDKSAISPSRI